MKTVISTPNLLEIVLGDKVKFRFLFISRENEEAGETYFRDGLIRKFHFSNNKL